PPCARVSASRRDPDRVPWMGSYIPRPEILYALSAPGQSADDTLHPGGPRCYEAESDAMKKDVNGITIAYHDQGTGPPIVFLHAFPLNRTMWAAQEAALSGRFRTISIDARGLGESDAPFWRYSMEQYARDVKDLLAGLGVEKAL